MAAGTPITIEPVTFTVRVAIEKPRKQACAQEVHALAQHRAQSTAQKDNQVAHRVALLALLPRSRTPPAFCGIERLPRTRVLGRIFCAKPISVLPENRRHRTDAAVSP